MNKTHLDNLTEMLVSIGYIPKITEEGDRKIITISDNNGKVSGYIGFVAEFYFNEDGSLNNIGIYE
jgi:hypothetical protein